MASHTESDSATCSLNVINMKENNTFPFKTYRMIDHCNQHDPNVASWINDGNEFVLKDTVALENKYLPQFYMTRSKFSSFIRQLNMYGFRNVTAESSTLETKKVQTQGSQHVVFRHDSFREGRPDLLDGVQRSRTGDHTQRKQRENEALKNTTASLEIRIGRVEDKVKTLNDKMDQVMQKLDNLFDIVAGGNCTTCSSCAKCSNVDHSSKRHKRDASVLIPDISSDVLDVDTTRPMISFTSNPEQNKDDTPVVPQLPQNQSKSKATNTRHKAKDNHNSSVANCVQGSSLPSHSEPKDHKSESQEESMISNGFFYDFFSLKGCNVFPEESNSNEGIDEPSSDPSQQDEGAKDQEMFSDSDSSSESHMVHQEKDPEAGKSDPDRAIVSSDDCDVETIPDIDFPSLEDMNDEKLIRIPYYPQDKPLGGFMRQHQRVALSTAFIMIAVAISLGFARPHVHHGQDLSNSVPPSATPTSLESLVPSSQPTKNALLPTSVVIQQYGPAEDPLMAINRRLQMEETLEEEESDESIQPDESVDKSDNNDEKNLDNLEWITDYNTSE